MNNIEKAKKEVVQDFKSKFVKEQNIFECTEDKPIIIPSNDNPPSKVIPWLESLVETLIKQFDAKGKVYKIEKAKKEIKQGTLFGYDLVLKVPEDENSIDEKTLENLLFTNTPPYVARKSLAEINHFIETLIKQTEERVREEVKERLYKLEKMAGDVNPNPKSFSDGVRNGYTKGLKFAVEYLNN